MTRRPVFARPALLAAVAAVAAAMPLAAAPPPELGTPEPVADLETALSNPGSDPSSLLRVGDRIYFAARDPLRGHTLWRTDGTAEGTAPVTDLCPGACDVTITELTAVGERLFFVTLEEPFSFRGSGGWKTTLWTSDGTGDGTVPLLRSVARSPASFTELRAFRGSLYFVASGPGEDGALWTSDGTREGTRPTGLCPGTCEPVIVLGDRLLLRFPASETGLWVTDGTPGGTRPLAEVQVERPFGDQRRPAVAGGQAFLNAHDPEHGTEAWVTDGTPEGTFRLGDLSPGIGSGAFQYAFVLGGSVYLLGAGSPDGPRFWRTDGTPEGTRPASELLDAGRTGLFINAAPPAGDRLLYLTTLPPGAEEETLWRFDAATGETRLVHDEVRSWPAFTYLGTPLGEGLVFNHGQHGLGVEPWFTDGTPAGTRLLRDIAPGLRWSDVLDHTLLGGRVVFTAEDDFEHRELWITDGTPGGTELLADVSPDRAASDPHDLTVHRGRLHFGAGGAPGGLFAVTGAGDRVELIDGSGAVSSLASAGDALYMIDAGGRPMALRPGAPGAQVLAETRWARHFTAGPGGRAYFGTLGAGEALWSSDGTPEGTRLVVDVDPRWTDPCFEFFPDCPPPELDEPSYPSDLTAADGRLLFVAVPRDGHHPALWASDGTAGGTVRVSPEDAGPIYEASGFRGGVLFIVRDLSDPIPDHVRARSLWWSDGTAAGTRRLLDLGTRRTPERLSVTAGRAFFLVAERGGPLTLWRTDGTGAGTVPVAPLGTARHLVDVDEIVAANGRAFLSVWNRDLGDELWTSDGTAAGTRPVRDLWPGPRGSNPSELTPVGPYLVFAADDGTTGHEPWITDGTAEGTVRVGDVHEGPAPSSPAGFAAAGGRVYFSADDGRIDRELWSFPLALIGDGEAPPPPDDATFIVAPELSGFRIWVRITAGDAVQPVRREPCIPETLCVSGAVPGRPELFVRIVGPKPNGNLWPTLVRFSTSTLEVWIEQESTGILRHYRLEGATPGSSSLDGLFDRGGFPPG